MLQESVHWGDLKLDLCCTRHLLLDQSKQIAQSKPVLTDVNKLSCLHWPDFTRQVYLLSFKTIPQISPSKRHHHLTVHVTAVQNFRHAIAGAWVRGSGLTSIHEMGVCWLLSWNPKSSRLSTISYYA